MALPRLLCAVLQAQHAPHVAHIPPVRHLLQHGRQGAWRRMKAIWDWISARSGWFIAVIGLVAWFVLLWLMFGDVL